MIVKRLLSLPTISNKFERELKIDFIDDDEISFISDSRIKMIK